jgi:hypothetical protein
MAQSHFVRRKAEVIVGASSVCEASSLTGGRARDADGLAGFAAAGKERLALIPAALPPSAPPYAYYAYTSLG